MIRIPLPSSACDAPSLPSPGVPGEGKKRAA